MKIPQEYYDKILNYTPGYNKIKDRSGPNNTRFCNGCEDFISIENFGINKSVSDGYNTNCKNCKIKIDKINKLNPIYKEKSRKRQREKSDIIKKQVVDHYGGKCACCGEKHLEFMQIDHINSGGYIERKELGLYGTVFYKYIIDNNYSDKYQILCANCNLARGAYGKCHEI